MGSKSYSHSVQTTNTSTDIAVQTAQGNTAPIIGSRGILDQSFVDNSVVTNANSDEIVKAAADISLKAIEAIQAANNKSLLAAEKAAQTVVEYKTDEDKSEEFLLSKSGLFWGALVAGTYFLFNSKAFK